MLERIEILREATREIVNSGRAAAALIQSDLSLKSEINALHLHFFGRTPSGCSNCYFDALMNLLMLDKNIIMSKFTVKAGVLLRTKDRDRSKTLSNLNTTDDLALLHIYLNPKCIEAFEVKPEAAELEAMLKEFGEKYEAERNAAAKVESKGDPKADKLINDATEEAADIVEKANIEAAKIIEAANEEARAITVDLEIKQANLATANGIVEKADEDAKAIKAAADEEAADIVEKANIEAAKIIEAANAEAKKANKSGKKEVDPLLD